jgi:NTP pyrophosphatase (non-canonical NTP hydrolase)
MREFDELVKIVEKLRGKEGCPWDKEQTMETLMSKVIEETNELKEAIEKDDINNIKYSFHISLKKTCYLNLIRILVSEISLF